MTDYYDDQDDDQDDDDDGYYEELKPPSRRGSPVAVTVLAAFAVIAILAAGLLVWAARQIDPPGEPGQKIASIDIPTGSSLSDVATLLENNHVISSARVFDWYAKFNSVKPVKAGRYVAFEENSAMGDAVKVLNAGPVPVSDVVLRIIPGMWLEDALAQIHKVFPTVSVDSLRLTLISGQVTSKYHPDPRASWEGYLLPETYQFRPSATPLQILQKLVDQFDTTATGLGYGNATSTTGHTAQDLVIIASMIERETGDPDSERPKIARVIFNRLDRGTPLGIDATLLYGLHRKGNEQPLTKSELEADGPYNSRLRKGLPPTAISLPSKKSLEAAIGPADGPWIYYVLQTTNPRTHLFTASAAEFERAKAACRKNGLC